LSPCSSEAFCLKDLTKALVVSAFVLVLVASMVASRAKAQFTISVWTDSPMYDVGDPVRVSFETPGSGISATATIDIYGPFSATWGACFNNYWNNLHGDNKRCHPGSWILSGKGDTSSANGYLYRLHIIPGDAATSVRLQADNLSRNAYGQEGTDSSVFSSQNRQRSVLRRCFCEDY